MPSVTKGDWIGFTFNGIHSSELGFIRVSDGSRYNENILPTMKDAVVQVPGENGSYFFGSYYTQKVFNFNIAFDTMTERQFRMIKQVFGDGKIHDLILDEHPYKIYSAKIQSPPQLKYLCFYENGQRIYKGEGTIQLVAYSPFARNRWTKQSDIIAKIATTTSILKGAKRTLVLNKSNVFKPGEIVYVEGKGVYTVRGNTGNTINFYDMRNFIHTHRLIPNSKATHGLDNTYGIANVDSSWVGRRIYQVQGMNTVNNYQQGLKEIFTNLGEWLEESGLPEKTNNNTTLQAARQYKKTWQNSRTSNKTSSVPGTTASTTLGTRSNGVRSLTANYVIPLFNPGDIASDLVVKIGFYSSEYASSIGPDEIILTLGNQKMVISNDDGKILKPYNSSKNDNGIYINGRNKVIQGVRDGVEDHNTYNEYITQGDFFKVEPGDSTLKVSIKYNNSIKDNTDYRIMTRVTPLFSYLYY